MSQNLFTEQETEDKTNHYQKGVAVSIGIILVGAVFENAIWTIIGLILLLFSEVIAMTILSDSLDGFMIVGFWPKVLLSICFFLFHLKAPSDD